MSNYKKIKSSIQVDIFALRKEIHGSLQLPLYNSIVLLKN
jgi:hypothetical protein